MQQALPGLSELDLSHNLISSWAFVTELAAALPQLHTLNLSGNRLALPSLPGSVTTAAPGAGSSSAEQAQQPSGSVAGGGSGGSQQPVPAATAVTPTAQPASLTGIRTLVLNGCGATWQQAVAIAQQLPNLRELHLCTNGMCSLQLPGQSSAGADGGSSGSGGHSGTGAEGPGTGLAGLSLSSSVASSSSSSSSQLLAAAFPQLEVLDLEGNELSSWADVAALSTLPRLRSLQLSGNRLPGVQYSGGGCWLDQHQWSRLPLCHPITAAHGLVPKGVLDFTAHLEWLPILCPLPPALLQASPPSAPCCWVATGWPTGLQWMRSTAFQLWRMPGSLTIR